MKINASIDELKKWYYTRSSEQRHRIVKFGVLAAALLLISGYYHFSGRADKKEARQPEPVTTKVQSPIDDPKLLKGDIVTSLQQDREKIREDVLTDLSTRIKNGELSLTAKPPTDLSNNEVNINSNAGSNPAASSPQTMGLNGAANANTGYPKEFSYPAPLTSSIPADDRQRNGNEKKELQQPTWVGGINMDTSAGQPKLADDDNKKKTSNRSNFLLVLLKRTC
ncbi:hypothetical protein [Dickeya sp. NCPPB 3274]|uniref:hypothetical protein n=1 Tax=Dickeya sp. NCPPB 3274 TaxID=568766 RepID=UPI0006ACB2E9|nr:hypothetical protein [Dickeya sp. NCPPB 3274]